MARAKAAEPQEYDVHPVADLFPMLADDELAELAADIKARGLLQPIVLDPEGRILDGRNRLAACRIAGVEPDFTTFNGADPDGYALAVNVARRHLNASQRAMIVALYPDSGVKSGSTDLRDRAVVVRNHAPDLAPAVVAGTLTVAEAYEEAQERKRVAEQRRADLIRLKREAPDLYELAESGKQSPGEAIAALSYRVEQARREEEQRRTEEQRREHEESVRRQQEIDAAREIAARIVGRLQADVAAIRAGVEYGADGLVTKKMVADLEAAVRALREVL